VRVGKRTGTVIPKPPLTKGPSSYPRPTKEGPKDTLPDIVLLKTFDESSLVPVLDQDTIEELKLKWRILREERAKLEEKKIQAALATPPEFTHRKPLPKAFHPPVARAVRRKHWRDALHAYGVLKGSRTDTKSDKEEPELRFDDDESRTNEVKPIATTASK